MSDEVSFTCPKSMAPHVQRVFSGEYNIAYDHPNPVVIDLGANVGSFALWASRRWPGCRIHCYEPLAENVRMLRDNLAPIANRVTIHPYAIGDPRHDRLFLGKNNCGEGSFFNLGSQMDQSVPIETRPPTELPPGQILKIDTEGAEVEILSMLPSIQFDAVLLEYHSEENRRRVDQLLGDYALVGGEILDLGFGVMKYINRRLVPS